MTISRSCEPFVNCSVSERSCFGRGLLASDTDAMKTTELTIQTGHRRGLVDLTDACGKFWAGEGRGLLLVCVPDAPAVVVVMEVGSGSDVDRMAALDRLLPRDDRW